MFERYTEPARRVLFFARYESSQFGSATIESGHFLLGLIREDEKGLQRFLPDSTTMETIRRQIEDQLPVHEKISTSIDIPLSEDCKRILSNAAEESKELGHSNIDTIHLLLGILREENCVAARVLLELGLELTTVREEIRRTSVPAPESITGKPLKVMWSFGTSPLPAAGVVPDAATAKRIAEAVWEHRLSGVPVTHVKAHDAELKYGVWIVAGSSDDDQSRFTLTAFIQKEDGKILRRHLEKLDS